MPKQIHAAHILVKTEQEAGVILFDLQRGADCAEMARKHSLCPSKKQGGDLGWFGKGQMVKEFEQQAFSLAPGTLSKPFKTQFGWHLLKVVESR